MKDRQDIDDTADSDIEVEPFDDAPQTDPTVAAEEAEPYFPPTDPVVRTDAHGETRIAGGFGSGALAADQTRGVTGDPRSDEALEDLVHRELRLDASTAQLHLKVAVAQGVVRLRGMIDDEMDAENALAVAGRVPGVVEVVDELSEG
jgi:hypothetical protein